MTYKKLLQQYTPEELADAFVFPVKLSPKKQKEADLQLAEARKRTQAEMTPEVRLSMRLMGLKSRIRDYINPGKSNEEYSFGYFLKTYIAFIELKRREFAAQIGIDETLLSQLINHHRTPPVYMPIRLELHSNNSIPSEYWWRIIERDREKEMAANKAMMIKKQRKFVKGGISVRV